MSIDIIKLLKVIMKTQKLSHRSLAKIVNVHYNTICNIFNDKASPSLELTMKIARVLECDIVLKKIANV